MRRQRSVFWFYVWTIWFSPCASLEVWDTAIHHHAEDDVVTIDFVPAAPEYNFRSYKLELWLIAESGNLTGDQLCDGLSGKPIKLFNVVAERRVVRKTIENIGPTGHYCVRVTPGVSCQSGCRTVGSKIFFLQGNSNPDVHDCSKWHVVITLDLQSLERRALVTYRVRNSQCLHSFRIDLWYKVKGRRCDGRSGYSLHFAVSSGLQNDVVFNALEPGNYCIRMMPENETCRGQCLPRFSHRIESLYELPSDGVPKVLVPAATSERKSDSSSAVWLYPTILGAVILSLTALMSAICSRRWKRRIETKTRVCNQVLQVEVAEQKPKPNCDSTKSVSDVEVVVLYSHDSKLQEEGARFLVDFLLDCCGFRVCTAMGDLHLIAISPEAWIVEKLSTCKIVIVESDEAIARGRAMLNRQSSSDGLLDKVFENSLQFLWKNNSLNSLIDYGRILVVRFSEPSSGMLQLMVPQVRYNLPTSLPDLYACLVEAGSVGRLLENPLPKWQSKPSYVRLCDFCSRARENRAID